MINPYLKYKSQFTQPLKSTRITLRITFWSVLYYNRVTTDAITHGWLTILVVSRITKTWRHTENVFERCWLYQHFIKCLDKHGLIIYSFFLNIFASWTFYSIVITNRINSDITYYLSRYKFFQNYITKISLFLVNV